MHCAYPVPISTSYLFSPNIAHYSLVGHINDLILSFNSTKTLHLLCQIYIAPSSFHLNNILPIFKFLNVNYYLSATYDLSLHSSVTIFVLHCFECEFYNLAFLISIEALIHNCTVHLLFGSCCCILFYVIGGFRISTMPLPELGTNILSNSFITTS